MRALPTPPKLRVLDGADPEDGSQTRLSMPPPAPGPPPAADDASRSPTRVAADDEQPQARKGRQPTWVSKMLRQPAEDSVREIQIAPGQEIPGTRFQAVRWLGDGGMGVVYEARQIDLDRPVALKILRHEVCGDPTVLEQFRVEARAASRIGSRYIVQVHDFAALADGRLLLAMELLEGRSLGREIADGPLDPGRCIAILRQLCKGLAAAHSASIVHRDIKPDNIFLTQVDGRPDGVKILDFGIAAVVDQGASISIRAAGTPDYIAPEIVGGLGFDHRADTYALGCTAYAMLTGAPPFVEPTVRETLLAHLEKTPEPPSARMGTTACPPHLEAVVLRCLAKHPDDRYASMHELEAALCEAQIEDGIQTVWDDLPPPDVDPDRRDALLRRMPDAERAVAHPRRRGLIGAGVVGLVLAAGFVGYQLRDDPTPIAAEDDGEIEKLMNRARAAGARNHYVYPPVGAPDTPTSYRNIIALEHVYGDTRPIAIDAAKSLRREFAETLSRLGDRYWDVPEARGFAMEYYVQALLFDPEFEPARSRAVISPAELSLLRKRAVQGDFTEGELYAVTPLEVLAQEDEKERERLLAAWMEHEDEVPAERPRSAVVADLAGRSGKRPAKAETAPPSGEGTEDPAEGGEEVAPDETPSTPRRDPGKARELAQEGGRALAAGKPGQAERLFQKALGYDGRSAQALIGLSDLAFNRGKYSQASDYAQRAVRAAPRNAGYRIKLGDAYFKVLRYREARDAYAKAVQLGAKDAKWRLDKVEQKLGK